MDKPKFILSLNREIFNLCFDTSAQQELQSMVELAGGVPSKEGHPFYTLPNCILTPHIAGSIGSECYRFGKTTITDIKRYLKGETLKNELSKKEFSNRA